MKAVLQRVLEASVTIDQSVVSQIGHGLLIYLGVEQGDTHDDVVWLAEKMSKLRIFPDTQERMQFSVTDTMGEILLVSQFSLCANVQSGNRPDFTSAAKPDEAIELYNDMADYLRNKGLRLQTGVFGAHMKIDSLNDGPVTILLDTKGR